MTVYPEQRRQCYIEQFLLVYVLGREHKLKLCVP